MRGTVSVILENARARLWVVPAVAALLAALAAVAVVWLDPREGDWLPLTVEASSARALLSGITGAMISFTALVFTITMLVLQQASSQLSPRVMRTFLRDRASQLALGLFVATFVFSLLVLIAVEPDSVPELGILGAIGLVLAAVLAFVAYIDHMAHAIRPTSVIRAIVGETRAAIDRNHPLAEDGQDGTGSMEDLDGGHESAAGQTGEVLLRWSGESGYMQVLDTVRLRQHAGETDRDLTLTVGIGDFLVQGAPWVTVHARPTPPRTPAVEPLAAGTDDDALAGEVVPSSAVRVGAERTMSQDPAFGFRQLVDIALRALSPSLNDPTTAIQVIDELHDLLRYLRDRPIPSPRVLTAETGRAVVVPAPDWEAFVSLAVDEIALAGRDMPRISGRLTEMLQDLASDAPAERLSAIRALMVAVAGGGADR
jgi:uncharacterized membrane protein